MAPQRNRRPGFSRRAQYVLFAGYVFAALGAVLGSVLVALSALNPPAFAAFRSAVAEVTTPVSSGLHAMRRFVIDIPDGMGDYFGVVGTNRALQAQVERDAKLVERARALVVENARLRRLMAVRDASGETVAVARLVNSTAGSSRRFATLNAGFRQGVRQGFPVRGPDGLIGMVLESGPNTARVLLAVDPESVIPVRRVRDGMPAIVYGRGDGMLDIRSAGISNLEYREGEMFATSGTGGVYPPDIPVARVTRSARDIAEARLIANPDALDFAIVQRPFLPAPPPVPTAPGP
ncbi:rod shape-determining protein MreC [Sphingomonas sp.]